MKVSRKKFLIRFLLAAFVFQFISNSLLGPEVGLFPANGDWYPGIDSPIAWQRTLAIILYPIKYLLIEPLSFLGQDPDPVPPLLVIAFAIYWTVIALLLHYLMNKIFTQKK